MIRKNRLFPFLIMLFFSLGIFSGCSGDRTDSAVKDAPKDEGLTIVATIFPNYDMTREIIATSGNVSLSMLMPPGADAHTYDLTPEDIKVVKNADIFIYTGDEMEPWVKKLRQQLGEDNKTIIVDLSKAVDLAKPAEGDALEAHDDDHEGEDAHEHDSAPEEGHQHSVDPHIWTSLNNAQAMTAAIASAMAEADPDNAQAYQANAQAYMKKLSDLDAEYRDLMSHAKRDTIVVADQFPFFYMARDYDLSVISAFDSCDEHAEPSARRIAQMQDYIIANHIPVIYYTELAEPKIAKKLSDATGAKLVLLNAAHTMSAEDMAAGKSYLDIMGENLKALEEGLTE